MKQLLKNYYDFLGRYRALYLLSALELIVIIAWSVHSGMGLRHCDSGTYYIAYDSIVAGYFPIARTPLYPILIGFLRSLFGRSISLAIVYIFQSLVFICSIKWMGKTLERISNHPRLNYWFTSIYALYPGILTFCGYILTESLSVSLMSALVYSVTEAYYNNSYKKAALSGILCLILWLLRPALIYVTAIMLVFWCCILLSKRKKMLKTALYGLCLTLISGAALSIYAMIFYKEFHKFGITSVTTLNNYLTIRESKAIDVAEIESPQLKVTVDSMLQTNELSLANAYKECGQLTEQYGLAEVDKFVNDQIKRHPKKILLFLLVDRREILLNDSCIFTGVGLPTQVYLPLTLFSVKNGTAFLIFLMALLFLMYSDVKKRRVSYFLWLLLTLFIANYFTIWIAAPDDFTRLSASNYPVLIAISCWVSGQLIIKASKATESTQ